MAIANVCMVTGTGTIGTSMREARARNSVPSTTAPALKANDLWSSCSAPALPISLVVCDVAKLSDMGAPFEL